ncbi:U3 small nucleolar RNA-associated protein 18 homolog [Pararge aegeria]|uniref:Jg23255 protein n=2 Tax=Pararge aegeria TaxID=116150 RepID=A0A8S4QIP0_9NEOP|nr:U3 small nucleolar RNA-associated protein 18 homolog [Pararge aegeria]CAH2209437.1 jg23255 [Pararge aegeria aegeria]
MKRKISSLDQEESRVSSLLFNKSNKFTENLSASHKKEIDIDLKPAWVDEDDQQLSADIISKVKGDGLYTQKLKQKYEILVGTPSWANIANAETDNDKLTSTVGHLKKTKSKSLKKGILELQKFPKINSETGNEGPIITTVEFHPKMSVALVGGQSGVVSLFSVGGDVNNKLHSFKIKSWKVTAAQFNPEGTEAYIASKTCHNYYVYDLVKAEPKEVQLPRAVKRPITFKLSPNGKFLATCDAFNEIYIICAKSKELLRTLKNNSNVQSLAFSHNSEQLYCYGIHGEVTVWDLSMYRSVNKFIDNGCVTASCIATSSCGQLLATGSGEGIVNVYETQNLTSREPLPLKTISNLTTKITNLTFNSSTEILSVTSSYYPNAVKLIHIPSYHVFSNFPKQSLQQVETVSFSPNSGYMALGNNKGYAYLFRLKHYKNY